MPASVKGFGCRPVVTYPPVLGPASESLRGRNARGLGGRSGGGPVSVGFWHISAPVLAAPDERLPRESRRPPETI
jgi:hypothetical protein